MYVYAPAVVKHRQNFVVGQLPVFALADERAKRGRAYFAGTHVKLGFSVSIVIEQHPTTDVLPLKVTFRTHRRRQLYSVTGGWVVCYICYSEVRVIRSRSRSLRI